jgi:hypothetical protein
MNQSYISKKPKSILFKQKASGAIPRAGFVIFTPIIPLKYEQEPGLYSLSRSRSRCRTYTRKDSAGDS